ncbi:MAG: hypothetical protein EAZ92_16475 [Candidatus Kapaibacterium sp.]|nr:MAG: hypothetical protein EAZ92_16475 [Candidatus Kapabacteria bacterium]
MHQKKTHPAQQLSDVQPTTEALGFLLTLRRNQLSRELRYLLRTDRLGVIIGGVVVCFFIAGMFVLAQGVWGAAELTLGAISILWTLHHNRRDRDFLIHFSLPHQTLFAVEYCVVCSPLALIFLAAKPLHNWAFVLVLYAASLLLSRTPQILPHKRSNTFIFSFWQWCNNLLPRLLARFELTRTSYEWQASFRQRGAVVFALFVLALVASHLEWLVIACGVLALLLPLDVYGQGEPRFLLECLKVRYSSQRVVWYKILQGTVVASCLTAPFLALWLLRSDSHLADGGIAAGGLLLLVFGLVCVSVVSKYAFWKAGLSQRALVGVMVGWVGLLFWFPMLFPMPQLTLFFLYRKAVRTLDGI